MSLLPKDTGARYAAARVEVSSLLRPAREVGGDFYDHFFLDEFRLAFLIGDVSGKGIPAALYMAVTKTLLTAYSSPLLSPGEVVSQVNRKLCEEDHGGMFVTLIFGVLDTRSGQFEYCNAGHLPPLLLSTTGGIESLTGAKGVALGLARDFEYPVTSRSIGAGETIFLFTDGVSEALNAGREFFGEDRLWDLLRPVGLEPVAAVTSRVLREVEAFSGELEQTDDISVIAVRWTGKA